MVKEYDDPNQEDYQPDDKDGRLDVGWIGDVDYHGRPYDEQHAREPERFVLIQATAGPHLLQNFESDGNLLPQFLQKIDS